MTEGAFRLRKIAAQPTIALEKFTGVVSVETGYVAVESAMVGSTGMESSEVGSNVVGFAMVGQTLALVLNWNSMDFN
jgi:hypothetical protein